MSGKTARDSGSKPKDDAACSTPGNPVFSCMLKPEIPQKAWTFVKTQNPLYKTTSHDYGFLPPTYESSPCVYNPVYMEFSAHLGTCGMYRNNSLNTVVDKSRVYDNPNLQHTL
ncbi:piercer of microtubule wall 2 protein [Erpetoichthys calabaricus]|uniref:piercer of microtubule wall 2 protein n=1 Tax=Erpetoichthys calabaricus TaxID=27687 RepID=UPI00109FDC52|nr:piercer of microtubule wall 2 protein [Erpetoichthys calabaricus]